MIHVLLHCRNGDALVSRCQRQLCDHFLQVLQLIPNGVLERVYL
eukprot:SAG22_NODE_13743_length_396_cov_0.865320_2_plen_43_part_01